MPTEEIDVAIRALEIQLRHYENLFDQSLNNNEILSKVKVIYHDLKAVSDKLFFVPVTGPHRKQV